MRILMVSDVYFPRINGVSTSIQTFKSELKKMGHQVVLIAPDYKSNSGSEQDIIRIRSRKIPFDPEDRMMNYRSILKQVPELKQTGFDLVHIHTPFVAHYAGVKIARELEIPCIITYHTLFEEYLYHYIPFVPKQMLRLFARRFSCDQCNQVSGVVAPSSIIVNLLKNYGVDNNITIIPTGIDSKKFETGQGGRFRTRFEIPDNKKVLLNVSRIAFEKNIGVLIEMLKQVKSHIPGVLLVIAGEGPAKKSYIQQVSRMGLEDSVSFVGYLDRDSELVDCYNSADLFVFSSKTETQGLVLLEAMAAGTPVVSVAAMGTKDILNGCKGARISDGSVDDFCTKVVTLLKDRNALENAQYNARAYVRQWDSTALAKKMLEFYKQITRERLMDNG